MSLHRISIYYTVHYYGQLFAELNLFVRLNNFIDSKIEEINHFRYAQNRFLNFILKILAYFQFDELINLKFFVRSDPQKNRQDSFEKKNTRQLSEKDLITKRLFKPTDHVQVYGRNGCSFPFVIDSAPVETRIILFHRHHK